MGGKFYSVKWLLPLLPPCIHFIDLFGGSGVVLFSRDRSPLETYNDLDGNLVNFFRVLRDHRDELLYRLSLTPHSREELTYAVIDRDTPIEDQIERARQFFVLAVQVIGARAQTTTVGSWGWRSHFQRKFHFGEGRAKKLIEVAHRLYHVQIENSPATTILKKKLPDETLVYADPPYVQDTRNSKKIYATEMSDDDHRELAELLNRLNCKVAISGYDSQLYAELYPAPKWQRHISLAKVAPSSNSNKKFGEAKGEETKRVEVLWTNYVTSDMIVV